MDDPQNHFQVKRRPKAELLTIGTELVTGSVLNTNAHYLGRSLTQLGFQVHAQNACRDEKKAIHESFRAAFDRSDLIVVTGGLGPTPDDMTRESLAEFFGVPLRFSERQDKQITHYYRKRRKTVPKIVKQEAFFPANAQPIFNRFGIALGFLIEEKGRTVIVLPGVPGELTRLFETHVKPFLRKRFPNLKPASLLIAKTIGLSEPAVMKCLGSSFFKIGKFDFGIYPEMGEVGLRIYADSRIVTRRLRRRIIQTMGKHIYSFSNQTIEGAVGEILKAKKLNVTLAESCTGGQISEWLTRAPGASHYFLGSVVAYQNQVKTDLLGVPQSLLRKKGAVSPETAKAMAEGVRTRFGSDLGVAVTGIAGPAGGSAQKPIGLVYIAIASSKKKKVWREFFWGDRRQIQDRASKKALEYLWRWIRK